LEEDRARGFTISPNGIVTVAKTEDLSGIEPSSPGARAESNAHSPYFSRVAKNRSSSDIT
jgi:hypothetical protein